MQFDFPPRDGSRDRSLGSVTNPNTHDGTKNDPNPSVSSYLSRQFFKILIEGDDVEQCAARLHLDEQINVRTFRVL